MDELIEALNLIRPYLSDYGDHYPTGCEHDVLWLNVDVEKLPAETLARLAELSFEPSEEFAGSLISFKYGSC